VSREYTNYGAIITGQQRPPPLKKRGRA